MKQQDMKYEIDGRRMSGIMRGGQFLVALLLGEQRDSQRETD